MTLQLWCMLQEFQNHFFFYDLGMLYKLDCVTINIQSISFHINGGL